MALPPPPCGCRFFQFITTVLTVVAGITGVAVVLLGREVALATSVLGEPLPSWFFATPGRMWLILQAVLVIVAVGAMFTRQSFKLSVIGTLAGLVFVTPVGLLTVVPTVSLLALVLVDFYAFPQLRPSWPPPGPWLSTDDAGRKLRHEMLRTPPPETGTTPTSDFARVYGILIEWSIAGPVTAMVFSTSTGVASLYTTATGLIADQGHRSVRTAAIKFVKAADRLYDAAATGPGYAYPPGDRVRFFLLTVNGVRGIETDLASVRDSTGRYSELFALGQRVLDKLRRHGKSVPDHF